MSKKEEKGIPIEKFWEGDDGVRMDDIIRVERYIKSNGAGAAQIWGAWLRIKNRYYDRHSSLSEEGPRE